MLNFRFLLHGSKRIRFLVSGLCLQDKVSDAHISKVLIFTYEISCNLSTNLLCTTHNVSNGVCDFKLNYLKRHHTAGVQWYTIILKLWNANLIISCISF